MPLRREKKAETKAAKQEKKAKEVKVSGTAYRFLLTLPLSVLVLILPETCSNTMS